MKITLISLGFSTNTIGIRRLSALFKNIEYRTQLIFFPTRHDLRQRAVGGKYIYSEETVRKVREGKIKK
jgi:hypothetical protein